MTHYDRMQARFIRMYKHAAKIYSLDGFKPWERKFYHEVVEIKNKHSPKAQVYLIGKNRVTIAFGFTVNIEDRKFLYVISKRNNEKKEVNIISIEGENNHEIV